MLGGWTVSGTVMMPQRDDKAILGFTDLWFTTGVVTQESVRLSRANYDASDDHSSEHYRYGAFCWYLSQHRPLAPSACEALYELGEAEPEISMGGAIMADIVDLPECPPSVLAKALVSGRKHLVRKAERKKNAASPSASQRLPPMPHGAIAAASSCGWGKEAK